MQYSTNINSRQTFIKINKKFVTNQKEVKAGKHSNFIIEISGHTSLSEIGRPLQEKIDTTFAVNIPVSAAHIDKDGLVIDGLTRCQKISMGDTASNHAYSKKWYELRHAFATAGADRNLLIA